jgi:hypothetical protein
MGYVTHVGVIRNCVTVLPKNLKRRNHLKDQECMRKGQGKETLTNAA